MKSLFCRNEGQKILHETETFNGTIWNSQLTDDLPDATFLHCIVKINSSTLLSIGGSGASNNFNHTYFCNAQSNKWTPGLSLKVHRNKMSCGILQWNNSITNQSAKVVVAAGGYGNDNADLSSVLPLSTKDSRGQNDERRKMLLKIFSFGSTFNNDGFL